MHTYGTKVRKLFELTSPKLKGKQFKGFQYQEFKHFMNIAELKFVAFQ